MKTIQTLILVFISILSVQSQINYADLQDGTSGVAFGYGQWGANNVVVENQITDVANDGEITFYHPDIAETQLPTIFFISGWGRPASSYEKIFHFLASHGYSVVSIYNNTPGNIVESYQFSLNMILASVDTHYTNWIDTTKVGLMGHSYGAGSTIWLGKHIFGADYNWGQDGRFIFMSAPWYSLLVTEDDLINYPSDVKLLIEISNDDFKADGVTRNTDERAIRAVFELINIPNSEKDFVRVFSSPDTYQFDSNNDGTTETFSYESDHYVSYTGITNAEGYQPWDALDVLAINRLSHALIHYVFENGGAAAQNVALGNGSVEQIDMDFLTDLEVTDTPIITIDENEFSYKCNTTWNDFADGANVWFLQNACDDTNGDGIIDLIVLSASEENIDGFSIYPVPTSNYLTIRFNDSFQKIKQLEITDITGRIVYKETNPSIYTVDTSNLNSGTYFIKVVTKKSKSTQAFIVAK